MPEESPAEPPAAPPKVLFIAGMTRSGTTLLGNVLNELPGFVGVGEVRSYWRAIRDARTCGCGAAVPQCEFWSQVAGWIEHRHGPIPVDRALVLQDAHIRSLPLQLVRLMRARKGVDSPGAEYAQLLAQMYAGIGAISSGDVVVDSSKGPHDAYVISRFTELDLFVVHLVRDPRGVAYSWSRRTPNPDKPAGYFEQQRPSSVAVRWLARNAITEALLARRLGDRYMRVRYEDFVSNPADTVDRITGMCRAGGRRIEVSDNMISFGSNHNVSGNPNRLTTGPVPIRPDREWTERMPRRRMFAATVGAAPLLRHYGYHLRPRPG